MKQLIKTTQQNKITRITISLDKEIEEKLKDIQNQFSLFNGEYWSLSRIINMVLVGGILGSKVLKFCDWYTIKRFMDGEDKNLEGYSVEYASYFAAYQQEV